MGHSDVKEFVVKVQIPLVSSDGDMAKALVYNEDRSVLLQTGLTKKSIRDLFGKDEFKIYCNAKLEKGKLGLLDKVKSPGW